jgi:hypothetical protein
MFKSKVIQHSPHKSQHEWIFSTHATQGARLLGQKKQHGNHFQYQQLQNNYIIIMRPCDYGLSN